MPITRAQAREQRKIGPTDRGQRSDTTLPNLRPPNVSLPSQLEEQGPDTRLSIDSVLCKEDSSGNVSSFDLRVLPTTVRTRPSRSVAIFLSVWHTICLVFGWLFRGTWPYPTTPRLEHFERTIKLVFVVDDGRDGREVLRHAKALFDTGNPKNLISPALLKQFGNVIADRQERHVLDLPGNGKYISVGKVKGRWTCDNDTFYVGPRFISSEFEISKCDERFEIIIGSDTIVKERLAILNVPAGFTGWRTEFPHVDAEKNKLDQPKQNQLRKQNEADKQKRQQKQKDAERAARHQQT